MAGLVKDALEKGAEPVVGGGLEHEMGGCFFPPTLLVGCALDMRISQEEIFGPVVGVMKFSDEDEALAMSNRRVLFLYPSCIFVRQRVFLFLSSLLSFGAGCPRDSAKRTN